MEQNRWKHMCLPHVRQGRPRKPVQEIGMVVKGRKKG